MLSVFITNNNNTDKDGGSFWRWWIVHGIDCDGIYFTSVHLSPNSPSCIPFIACQSWLNNVGFFGKTKAVWAEEKPPGQGYKCRVFVRHADTPQLFGEGSVSASPSEGTPFFSPCAWLHSLCYSLDIKENLGKPTIIILLCYFSCLTIRARHFGFNIFAFKIPLNHPYLSKHEFSKWFLKVCLDQ